MKTKLVIFGITGDLSTRKLLPALQNIVKSGRFQNLSVIGVSRRKVDIKALIEGAIGKNDLVDKTTIFSMDLSKPDDYTALKKYVDPADDEQILIYLSVPPNAAADIVDYLGRANFNGQNVKLLFEKPFGFDVESARDFIDRTDRYFTEKQIYRIDHYMAKEVAAEVIRLRSNAEHHSHNWSNRSVATVDIVASEAIGIEDRSVFYEQTGALRDFVQGHLMQLLSLVLMDLSPPFSIDQLADRRLKAMQAVMPANPETTIRAQYRGYDDDVDNKGSQTETFVSMVLESTDPTWVGVPLYLATGKNLDSKRSAIVVTYIDGAKDEFVEESIPSSNKEFADAYERVLVEAIRGRKYVFTTSPEIIRSWEIMTPLQKAWSMSTDPLQQYEPGSNIADVIKKASLHQM